MRTFFLIAIVLISTQTGFSQVVTDSLTCRQAHVSGGDTLISIQLAECTVSNNESFAVRYQKRYFKTEKKVLKVYPYAKAAGKLMREYEAELAQLPSEKARKKYIKGAEEELKAEFEGEIKKMTISEGMILIKLIDRETGDTSYELIKELRGSFSAFLWQSLARIFGSNLKEDYDPEVEDRIVEDVVRRIERGDLIVGKRVADAPQAKKKKRKKDRR